MKEGAPYQDIESGRSGTGTVSARQPLAYSGRFRTPSMNVDT